VSAASWSYDRAALGLRGKYMSSTIRLHMDLIFAGISSSA
jgi:hypothetical protein